MSESPSLTPDAFESLLADLDDEAFAAFVADLWSRGGWRTDREGPVLAVTRGGETERFLAWTDDRSRIERLLGADPDPPDPGAIDAVVTRRRDAASARAIADTHGADVINADGLYDRLLYAIDRDAARDLCRTYFGDDVEPRPPPEPGSEGQWMVGPVRPRTLLVAVALLALVATVGVGLSGQPPGEGGPATPETPAANGADTPVITPAGGGAVGEESPTDVADEGTAVIRTETPSRSLRPTRERFEELRANASGYRNSSVSCMETPGTVVETAVGALRFNDPERNDGLRTVWRLVDATNLSFESFQIGITSPIYRPLYDFDRVAFESATDADTETEAPAEATALRTVVVARNGSIARYEFRLRRASTDCWRIDQLFRTPIDRRNTVTDTATTTNAGTSTDTGTSTNTATTTDTGTPTNTANTTTASGRDTGGVLDQPGTRFAWQDR